MRTIRHPIERATKSQIRERLAKAESDPNILSMGVVETMKRYRLNYTHVLKIRRALTEKKLRAGQTEEIIRIDRKKELTRLRGRVLRAETRYPMLHRRVLTDGNMAAVAASYGLTRERVRQLMDSFEELVLATARTKNSILDEIETESS